MTALTLLCQVCGGPITNGTGYAAVNRRAAAERGSAFREWRTGHPGVLPRKGPKRVRWRLVHAACDREATSLDFRLPAERMKTLESLVYRTVSLAERPWFPNSDWRRLVRRVLKQQSSVAAAAHTSHREISATGTAGQSAADDGGS